MSSETYDQAQNAFLQVRANLASGAKVLRQDRLVLQSAQSPPAAVAREIMEHVAALNAVLLDTAHAAMQDFGSLQYSCWAEHYVPEGPPVTAGPCVCDGANMRGEVNVNLFAPSHRRSIDECPVCGPVGEDDGRQLLKPKIWPQTARVGQEFAVTVGITAPETEFLVVDAMAVLEDWHHVRRMLSAHWATHVDAGGSVERKFVLDVPTDLPPGVYSFSVLAVVNMELTIKRSMLHVKP